MHLGLVAPLPPTPSGVAEWIRFALPMLEEHAEITCFVPDLDAVDSELRKAHRVRPIGERGDPNVDMLVYHIGNNRHHEFVFDALREGPAGLIEVHDGSLHHYVQDRTLGVADDPLSYVEFGEAAHGWAGRRLADIRWRRYRGSVELFLYDYLQIALDRARGVIVHSRYAEELVQLRCPRVHTWVVPLHAPRLTPNPSARSSTGVSPETLLVAHAGFVTIPKRADVYLEAVRMVLDRGLDIHFVFAGQPDPIMAERLPRKIEQLRLQEHVTITGYLETVDLERWIQAVDVIVNLRAPHVGESSGSLAYGLAAGKAIVVQPIGSWAELPDDVVVRLPVTDDDADALASTLFALGQDETIRARFGSRAQRYAIDELDADACAGRLVRAAREAAEREWTPAAWISPGRTVAARTFLQSGIARIEAMLDDDQGAPGAVGREALVRITPARPRARLLAIDAPRPLLQLLSSVWGYEVDATVTSALPGEISLEAHPGVPACTLTSRTFVRDEMPIDEYDVIVVDRLPDSPGPFLDACNRALTPQGLLVILQSGIDAELLDRSGLSPHVHEDNPGWTISVDDTPSHVSVGTKASVPIAPLA